VLTPVVSSTEVSLPRRRMELSEKVMVARALWLAPDVLMRSHGWRG
jgi:hypothetical protein